MTLGTSLCLYFTSIDCKPQEIRYKTVTLLVSLPFNEHCSFYCEKTEQKNCRIGLIGYNKYNCGNGTEHKRYFVFAVLPQRMMKVLQNK